MKIFFDTEFIEDGKTIDLLSIGAVREDGKEFYAESAEADWSHANDWVRANVLPHLREQIRLNRAGIAAELLKFVNHGEARPEFWAYYADYDWVVLCQLYGKMIDLPEGWPKFCMDVKQYAVMLGDPKLPKQTSIGHNALNDARWTKEAYEFLWQMDN